MKCERRPSLVNGRRSGSGNWLQSHRVRHSANMTAVIIFALSLAIIFADCAFTQLSSQPPEPQQILKEG